MIVDRVFLRDDTEIVIVSFYYIDNVIDTIDYCFNSKMLCLVYASGMRILYLILRM